MGALGGRADRAARSVLVTAVWRCGIRADSGDVIRTTGSPTPSTRTGTIDVAEDIDYAFATPDRHGIYRTLITRQPFSPTSKRTSSMASRTCHHLPGRPAKFDSKCGGRVSARAGSRRGRGCGQGDHQSPGALPPTYTLTGALRTTGGNPIIGTRRETTGKAAIAGCTSRSGAPAAAGMKVVCYQGLARATTRCDGAGPRRSRPSTRTA